jgi:hypothetical protein
MEKNLEQSELIEEMPAICADELAAVEFFEERFWNGERRPMRRLSGTFRDFQG